MKVDLLNNRETSVNYEDLDIFMNMLKDTGKINMMGSASYIEEHFGVSTTYSKVLAKDWLFKIRLKEAELKNMLTKS